MSRHPSIRVFQFATVLLGEMRAQLDEERVWSETSTGTRMAGSGAEGETLAD